MSSPFKRFGRAIDNFKGGLKQIGSAVLPAGMIQSAHPQRVLAHPQTGQLILKGMTTQPEEGMYSVFSMDGVEILVRYSKILAYTLPQAPAWKDTEMVYVSPKLDALNLHNGASFTVFVGRVHYLVMVIEQLAKVLPKYTHSLEEASSNADDSVIIDQPPVTDFPDSTHHRMLEDQTRELQHDLQRQPRTPRMSLVVPQNTPCPSSLDPFGPKIDNDKALKQSAKPTNTMDEIKPIPIPPPTTPQYNPLIHGIAASRVPPTPISPWELVNRSKRETENIPTTNNMAKRSSINTRKSERRKTSPSPKQLLSLPLSEYGAPTTDINGEDRAEPPASPQSSRSTSRSSLASAHGTYSSEEDYGKNLNHAKAVTSKKHSTDGSRKRMSKIKSTSSRATPNLNTNGGAQAGKKSLAKIPVFSSRNAAFERETILLTPKGEQPKTMLDEYYFYGNASGLRYSQTPPCLQQHSPASSKVSSPLPPLRNANDEIVEPNSFPRNVLPIGQGRRINQSERHDFRDMAPAPAAGPSGSTRTSHSYSEAPSSNLSQRERKGKGRATEPCYLTEW